MDDPLVIERVKGGTDGDPFARAHVEGNQRTAPTAAHGIPTASFLRRFVRGLFDPLPMRLLVLRELDRWLGFLPYERRISLGSIERPEYGHGVCHAARLAAKLGHDRISAIEFGVAGGNGLVALEKHARLAGAKYGVGIDVFGFDNATGMPPPTAGYREMLYFFREGYFPMDEAALRARLRRAELMLGRIEETLPAFIRREGLAPIGFIAFDVDYYSSTLAALKVLEAPMTGLLPRVVCYMDDIVGDIDAACNRHTGMLAAIDTFNQSHDDVKVERVAGLRHHGGRIPYLWHEQMYVAHLFRHRQYGQLTADASQLPLKHSAAARAGAAPSCSRSR